MNLNLRSAIIGATAVASILLGGVACGASSGDSPAPAPAPASRPDCDLGDLREGDSDCKDPAAYKEAVRKYGKKRVQDAEKKYADNLKKKTSSKPGLPGLRKQPTVQTTAPKTSKTSRSWPFSKPKRTLTRTR